MASLERSASARASASAPATRSASIAGGVGPQRAPMLGLRRLALGHVAEHEDHPHQLAAGLADRGAAVVDLDLAAVARDQHGVVREAHDRAFAQHADGGILDRLSRVGVEDPEDLAERSTPRLGLPPGSERLGHRIHEDDVATDVGRDHRVADAAQRDTQSLLAVAQTVLGGTRAAQEGGQHGGRERHQQECRDACGEDEPRRAARAYGSGEAPLLEQAALFPGRGRQDAVDAGHVSLPEPHADGFPRGARVSRLALRDHEPQLLGLRRQDRREPFPAHLLRPVVAGELPDLVELPGDGGEPLGIGPEIRPVAREHVSTLGGFRGRDALSQRRDLLEDADRMAREVAGFERTLLLAQRGDAHREDQRSGTRERNGNTGLESPAASAHRMCAGRNTVARVNLAVGTCQLLRRAAGIDEARSWGVAPGRPRAIPGPAGHCARRGRARLENRQGRVSSMKRSTSRCASSFARP